MSQLSLDTHVADIVTLLPQSADLFREWGIDFCCGGKVPLKTAAEKKDLDSDNIYKQILQLQKEQGDQIQFDATMLGNKTLVAYIQEQYHERLRKELPALSNYISTVVNVHGNWQPHLYRIQEAFEELKRELLDHTQEEDKHVFPLILNFLEQPSVELQVKVAPHVVELEDEHEKTGRLLFEIREWANQYILPEDACATYTLVYKRLNQLEKDTFMHVHLENNILFERVRDMMD